MNQDVKESIFHKATIVCPKCGSEESATIWDSVNVLTDPDLKTRLLRKKLQNHVCANCNLDIVMAEPLVYHDPERKSLYCVLPGADFSERKPDGAAIDSLVETLCGLSPADTGTYRLRVVENYNQLIEKIHLADHGRQDRLMEVIKIAARKGPAVGRTSADISNLFYLTEHDGVMTFLVQGQDDQWGQMELDSEAYDNAENLLGMHVLETGTWESVDMAYAIRLINSLTP